jgi:hypothetical protein
MEAEPVRVQQVRPAQVLPPVRPAQVLPPAHLGGH